MASWVCRKADITDFGLMEHQARAPSCGPYDCMIGSISGRRAAASYLPDKASGCIAFVPSPSSARAGSYVPFLFFTNRTPRLPQSNAAAANGNNETAFAAWVWVRPQLPASGPVLSAYRLRLTEAAPPSSRAPARALVLSPDGSNHASFDFVSERRASAALPATARGWSAGTRGHTAHLQRATLVRAGRHRPRSFL